MKKLQITTNNHHIITSSHHHIIFLFSAFLLFFFLPVASYAQRNNCRASSKDSSKTSSPANYENKKVYFGVAAGPTIDWFTSTSKDLSRKNVKGGMIAGIHLDIDMTKVKIFYFSTGVLIRYLQADFAYDKEYDFSGISPIDSMIRRPTVTNYQTTYITVPTGFKFRTPPAKKCVFLGKLGLYHSFKIGGKQYDSFTLPNFNANPNNYFVSTPKIPNDAAAFFAESGYIGFGFEYLLSNNFRIFTNVDYSCQFNYFSSKAKSNITNDQFKTIVHSLHIVLGVLF